MTTFEPSLSTSTMRPPLSSAHAPSMADSLPSINFGFDDLRDRMAKFTVRFDTFIEVGRKRVLEERNQFRMNVAELNEDRRMKKKDIEILHLKTNSHAQTISKEAAETAEMNASIAVLSASRDTFARSKSALLAQISATQAAIDAKLASQRQYASHLSAQTVHDIPELDFWVSNLGLRIEGAGRDDRLRFVFAHVDERDWEREAWFELSTAARDYEVLNTSPKLEREAVERVVERVNETRELGGLLKGMRGLFVEAVRA